jgi:ABC transporter substrate binding protein (PQQ-dependent alcohol dehydrogenase system)
VGLQQPRQVLIQRVKSAALVRTRAGGSAFQAGVEELELEDDGGTRGKALFRRGGRRHRLQRRRDEQPLWESAGILVMAAGRSAHCIAFLLSWLVLTFAPPAEAQQTPSPLSVTMLYVTQRVEEPPPLSLVEPIATDKGLAGARLGTADNATTGQFLHHEYVLEELVAETAEELLAEVRTALTAGLGILIADLPAKQLLEVADLPEAQGAVIFNTRAEDDDLRTELCRANILHIAPSRAMKADALGQWLVFRRWQRWFLLAGVGAGDVAFANAVRRAAERFGGKIVEDRSYEYVVGARRTDTGHAQVQQQMTLATQRAPEYDVLVVSDESDVFGEYLPYRTWDPRPVVGTQGLVPTSWSRVHEQWGATQIQRRFTAAAGRPMLERDYAAWLAARAVGEAVTRTGSSDPGELKRYLVSSEFKLAGFKGVPLTFRPWNQQLRQPILIAGPRTLVSVSPQEGFLHPVSPLDTLGYDEPETRCRLHGQ